MKRIALAGVLLMALGLLAPALLAQEEHGEFGVFADYTRLRHISNSNFWGVGGQIGFNLSKYVQLEGGMAYDFEQNITSNTTPVVGVSTNFQPSRLRLLNGLFGPKFQTGVGPVKAFFVAKGGFLNFGVSRNGVATGFANQVGTVPHGDTNGVFYPGGGVEFFAHNIGARVEVGDEIYFDNGANHNLKFAVGPVFRW